MRVKVIAWNSAGNLQLRRHAGEPLWVSFPVRADAARPLDLVNAIRRDVGVDSALLRVVASDAVEVEVLGGPRAPSPASCRWEPARLHPPAAQRPAWHQPGWLGRMLADIDGRLTECVIRRGEPQQLRHTSVTGLLRLPTTSGAVWAKASLPMFSREPGIVGLLHELHPNSVPAVLAQGPGWWVSSEFPDEDTEPAENILQTIAWMQVSAISRTDRLRQAGCPDRGPGRLVSDIERLSGRADLLSADLRRRLAGVLPRLGLTVGRLLTLGFPPSLVHGDLHAQNVRWTSRGWFIFDWTDACIAHPIADLAYTPIGLSLPAAGAAARAYTSEWLRIVPEPDMRRGLTIAPVLCAAHQISSYEQLLDAVNRSAGDESGFDQLRDIMHFWLNRLIHLLDPASSDWPGAPTTFSPVAEGLIVG